MKSICFFSSYFTGGEIPFYVKYYLDELTKHFSEIVLLTNEKEISQSELSYLAERRIQLRVYVNEGMDFGMWYKAFSEFDTTDYDRVGLINDSCVLFKSLSPVFAKANSSSADAFGMVLTGKFSLHLQSYFILLNKRAIPVAKEFFAMKGIIQGYKRVIFEYEIALSEYLRNHNLSLDGYFNYSENKYQNPSYILIKDLIANGAPMIKKKLLSRRFTWGDYLTWMRNNIDIDHRKYVQVIMQHNKRENIIDLEKVIKELGSEDRRADIYIYWVVLFFYRMFSRIGLFRSIFHGMIKLKRFIERKFNFFFN